MVPSTFVWNWDILIFFFLIWRWISCTRVYLVEFYEDDKCHFPIYIYAFSSQNEENATLDPTSTSTYQLIESSSPACEMKRASQRTRVARAVYKKRLRPRQKKNICR